MANGPVHDKVNLFVGGLLIGLSWGWGGEIFCMLAFLGGWVLSTFYFSPDTDLGPKKRAGPFRFLLYPYSFIFRHRGLSHTVLFGTLTRIGYALLLAAVAITILHRVGVWPKNVLASWEVLTGAVEDYDYHRPLYKRLTWFFLGLYSADLIHILLDKSLSLFRRRRRRF